MGRKKPVRNRARADDIHLRDSRTTQVASRRGRRSDLPGQPHEAGKSSSLHHKLEAVVWNLSAPDGPLTKAMQSLIQSALKPVLKDLDDLAKQFVRREYYAGPRDVTHKGIEYENYVLGMLQIWARSSGARVEHVGADNRPGDIVVEFVSRGPEEDPVRAVIEVRNRQSPLGRKAVFGGFGGGHGGTVLGSSDLP